MAASLRRTAFAAAAVAFLPAALAAGEVTVFAAASLSDAMRDAAGRFQAETGHDVTLSLAGSSALARQIRQGAPADVYIAANAGWMDRLEGDGLIDAATRFDLLRNAIVLIAHGQDAAPVEIGPDLDLTGMLGGGRLAMALVEAVPAGIYGKAALESLGLWDDVAPQVAQAGNVRAALSLVATGEAPMGIVYATDAAAEDDVTALATFPAELHPPIVYPAAAVASSGSPVTGAFLDFLRGAPARAAFEAQGFTVMAD